jgi:hypothetical protein
MTGRNGTAPRIITGCAVLPPLDAPAPPSAHPAPRRTGQPKGKPGGRPAARGRFATVNAFADFTLTGLCRAEIAVWLLLWRDTKADGLARTSQADLARRAGCDVSTVKRAVRRLVRVGLLDIARRGRLGAGPSAYRVRPLRPD